MNCNDNFILSSSSWTYDLIIASAACFRSSRRSSSKRASAPQIRCRELMLKRQDCRRKESSVVGEQTTRFCRGKIRMEFRKIRMQFIVVKIVFGVLGWHEFNLQLINMVVQKVSGGYTLDFEGLKKFLDSVWLRMI